MCDLKDLLAFMAIEEALEEDEKEEGENEEEDI